MALNSPRHEAGQMLLIVVFIVLVIAIAIPVIIAVNRTGGKQNVASRHAGKAESTALAGIAYAVQELAPIWPIVLTGTFPASTGCNNGIVTTPSGEPFALTCEQAGRPYEIHVISTARAQNAIGVQISSRSVETYLSQRTVGVKLANGFTASAALLLVNAPTGVQDQMLSVHWGPIVCLSSATAFPWVLYDPLNSATGSGGVSRGFPRKFSLGGITGNGSSNGDNFYRAPDWAATELMTDQKEFWAFASQTFAPVIDDVGYKAAAQLNNSGSGLQAHLLSTGVGQLPDGGSGSLFTVSGDTLVFDATFQPTAGSIIYVDGNVELDNLAVDLSTGALIVTKDLILNDTSASPGITALALNVPPTAASEYPYFGLNDSWPCQAYVGSQCTVNSTAAAGLYAAHTGPHFRGFLWVQGTIRVKHTWNMAGVIVAGNPATSSGGLIFQPTGTPVDSALTLAYDDIINHSILMASTELQSDSIRNLSK